MDGNAILNELCDLSFTASMNMRYYSLLHTASTDLSWMWLQIAVGVAAVGVLVLLVTDNPSWRRLHFATGVVGVLAIGICVVGIAVAVRVSADAEPHYRRWQAHYHDVEQVYFRARLADATDDAEQLASIVPTLKLLHEGELLQHAADDIATDTDLLLQAYNDELQARTGFKSYEEMVAADYPGPHPREEEPAAEEEELELPGGLELFIIPPGQEWEPAVPPPSSEEDLIT